MVYEHMITIDNINENLRKAEYAVRGELVIRANALQEQLNKDPSSVPFKKLVFCNIGNPQSVGQVPISFPRQVLALVECPFLLEEKYEPHKLFKPDVIERAKTILKASGGGTGAYSHSMGISLIRQHVAEFIEKRDGHPSNPNWIYLTNGASTGIQSVLQALIRSKDDAIMIPIPQYPLYSGTIALLGGSQAPYYLNEENKWSLEVSSLEESLKKSRSEGKCVRALVIINPGNPTGACLTRANIEAIIKFCVEHKLVLLADEVYQENIYTEVPFVSFKKVLMEMPAEYRNLELFSFHSVSKGLLGECGHRGGYMEAVNIHPKVHEVFYKYASLNLCPNTTGQVMVDLMVKPPAVGEESYDQYKLEADTIFNGLQRRAAKLNTVLNSLPGMSCQPSAGAMYAFPNVVLPKKACEAAAAAGKKPDTFYCLALLEATGICVIPGSGFGQKDGTFHFRTTFLPQDEDFEIVLRDMGVFHKKFMEQYQ